MKYTSCPTWFDRHGEGMIYWGELRYWERVNPSPKWDLLTVPFHQYTFERLIRFKGLDEATRHAHAYLYGVEGYSHCLLVRTYLDFLKKVKNIR